MRQYRVARSRTAVLVLSILMLSSPPATAQEATPTVDLSRLSPIVSNSFFPLASLRSTVLEGEEADPETGEPIQTRVELRVLPDTTTVAGVEVTVAEVKEYEDGELVEATLDYYAQDEEGTVYYLGERVDVYEEGTLIGHEGSWLAGEGANQPGVYMPAHPEAGQVFAQEQAPGVAEDRSTVLAVEQSIVTPAGELSGCLQVEDFAPIEGGTGEKYYCPGVGIAREVYEGGSLDLIAFESTTPSTPTAG